MCGMAFSPWIGTWLHGRMGWAPASLNLTVILVLGFFWTLLDFATVVATAVFGALVNDVVPRELIGRFYGLFRVVSLTAGILFNGVVIGHAKEYFVPILAGVGILFGVGVTLMCLRVKGRRVSAAPAAGAGRETRVHRRGEGVCAGLFFEALLPLGLRGDGVGAIGDGAGKSLQRVRRAELWADAGGLREIHRRDLLLLAGAGVPAGLAVRNASSAGTRDTDHRDHSRATASARLRSHSFSRWSSSSARSSRSHPRPATRSRTGSACVAYGSSKTTDLFRIRLVGPCHSATASPSPKLGNESTSTC